MISSVHVICVTGSEGDHSTPSDASGHRWYVEGGTQSQSPTGIHTNTTIEAHTFIKPEVLRTHPTCQTHIPNNLKSLKTTSN